MRSGCGVDRGASRLRPGGAHASRPHQHPAVILASRVRAGVAGSGVSPQRGPDEPAQSRPDDRVTAEHDAASAASTGAGTSGPAATGRAIHVGLQQVEREAVLRRRPSHASSRPKWSASQDPRVEDGASRPGPRRSSPSASGPCARARRPSVERAGRCAARRRSQAPLLGQEPHPAGGAGVPARPGCARTSGRRPSSSAAGSAATARISARRGIRRSAALARSSPARADTRASARAAPDRAACRGRRRGARDRAARRPRTPRSASRRGSGVVGEPRRQPAEQARIADGQDVGGVAIVGQRGRVRRPGLSGHQSSRIRLASEKRHGPRAEQHEPARIEATISASRAPKVSRPAIGARRRPAGAGRARTATPV